MSTVFMEQAAVSGSVYAQQRLKVYANQRHFRCIQMEAALLRAQGYSYSEIGEWQQCTREGARQRAAKGGAYVMRILEAVA